MLDLVLNSYTTDKTHDETFFEAILDTALSLAVESPSNLGAELLSKKVGVSINLVGSGRIRQLNKKHRGRNRVTDVLSFPMQYKIDVKKTKDAIIDLGDIFIAMPVAKKESKREGMALDKKLAQLTVHGFLHLLGYDHEKPDDKSVMFKLQDKILVELSNYLAK